MSEINELRDEVAQLQVALAYWENGVGPCRNCGWSPGGNEDDDGFSKVVALIEVMPEPLRLRTALAYSICPVHLRDYAICFDDQNPECVAVRLEHPEHDT